MSDPFDPAVAITLFQEGGLADDKDDPGGITHWGISLRYAQALGATLLDVNHDGKIDADDIRQLSQETAIEEYRQDWWDHYGMGKLPAWAGVKLLSLAVNMGPRPAIKCLQTALFQPGVIVASDGVIGPGTIKAAQWADPLKAASAFREAAWAAYQVRIQQNPVLAKYASGWKARAAF